jgi:hypothetical protein
MKRLSIIVMALVISLALIGAASAVVLPPQTNETNTNYIVTSVQCDGVVMGSSTVTMETSNQLLNGPPLQGGEVYGVATYQSHIMADGQVDLQKIMEVNTANSLVGQSNIETDGQLTFVGNTGGIASGSEDILTFNAGNPSGTNSMLCPFATEKDGSPFNTMAEQGSRYVITMGQISSQSEATAIAGSSDVPLSLLYNIDGTGSGLISAYENVFAQDTRGSGTYVVTPAKNGKPDKDPKYSSYGKDNNNDHNDNDNDHKPTPAVISAVYPAGNLRIHDTLMVDGLFSFHKSYAFTSGVTI